MLLFLSTKRFWISLLFYLAGVRTIIVGPFTGGGLEIIPITYFSWAISAMCILPETMYFRKDAVELWNRWNKTNESQKQHERMERALSGNVTVKRISTKSKCATFIGTSSKPYRTTLCSCTCPDFKKRKAPCKHMYYLANELNLL